METTAMLTALESSWHVSYWPTLRLVGNRAVDARTRRMRAICVKTGRGYFDGETIGRTVAD